MLINKDDYRLLVEYLKRLVNALEEVMKEWFFSEEKDENPMRGYPELIGDALVEIENVQLFLKDTGISPVVGDKNIKVILIFVKDLLVRTSLKKSSLFSKSTMPKQLAQKLNNNIRFLHDMIGFIESRSSYFEEFLSNDNHLIIRYSLDKIGNKSKLKSILQWDRLLKSIGRAYYNHEECQLLYAKQGSWLIIFALLPIIINPWLDLLSKVVSIVNGSFDIISRAKGFFSNSNTEIQEAANSIIEAAKIDAEKESILLAEELIKRARYTGEDRNEVKMNLAKNIKYLIAFIQSGNNVKQLLLEEEIDDDTLKLNSKIENDFIIQEELRNEIKDIGSGQLYEKLLKEGVDLELREK